ncbi:MAG: EAL domain-containing protein [Gammaproteobacteria bacterium]|nr:EAL domain-containing protein [Gammaproteobacteria bacterium]
MSYWFSSGYRLSGLLLLGLSLPLLVWQASPSHSVLLSQDGFHIAHSIMQMLAIAVSLMIFFTAYGVHDFSRSLRSVLLSYAALATGLFDMLHLLAYMGMPDLYDSHTAEKSIMFWLMGRAAISLGLFLYVLIPERVTVSYAWRRVGLLLTLGLIVLLSLLLMGHFGKLSQVLNGGGGFVSVKEILQWGFFTIFCSVALLLYLRRQKAKETDDHRLWLTLLLMAVGELFFSLHTTASHTGNLFGHFYKVVAYYYLYGAIFSDTVRRPLEQIEHLLVYDTVTDLPNRRALTERLEQQLARMKLLDKKFSLILLNLDHFHSVNAIFGHDVGDMLLANVATRIRSSMPEHAFLARFSNDEFCILLESGNPAKAERLGRSLQHKIAQGFLLGKDHVETGASIGIVVYPDDGYSANVLLRHANLALHQAKQHGRNGLVIFSRAMTNALERKVQLENGLKKALERQEFYLVYQPKVEIRSGKIIGAEALLRWRSQDLGNVRTEEFIPVAEESGLILAIGDWVMLEACLQIGRWYDQGLLVNGVAVNVSTRQFRQRDFVAKVKNVMAITHVPAGLLEIEITESAIMDNIDSAAAMLEKLSKHGIHITIDDFGTGYSSLSYLKSFALHALKIDRSFINDIPGDPDDEMLVRMIINLANNLGLTVIAEGVETGAQLTYLENSHCDQMQGNFFSKPVSAEEFENLLRTDQRLDRRARQEV